MSGSIFISHIENDIVSFAISTAGLIPLHKEIDKALTQSMGDAWTKDAEIEWFMTQIDLCDLDSDNFMIAFEATMRGCDNSGLLTDLKDDIKQAFEADTRFKYK